MTTKLEDRIRERAHAIWESEGRPEGEQERHWSEARAAIEAEENIGTTENLEDTELTSSLVTLGDQLNETKQDQDESGPSLLGEINGLPPEDLGGRVKDPV